MSCFLTSLTPAYAEVLPEMLENHSLRDLYMAPMASLYNPHQKTWNVAGLSIMGVGIAGSLILHQTADKHFPNSTRNSFYPNMSSRISDIGLFLPLATTSAFFLSTPLKKENDPAKQYTFDTAMELLESQTLTGLTSIALKYGVGRTRPDQSNAHSFPSFHTSLAFATAGTLMYRYPWYVGVGAMSAATLIGFSRMDLNKHYSSDVLAGAALGLLFSTGVQGLHRAREHQKHGPLKNLTFSPLMENGLYGVTFSTQL
ncbi:MAG: phosphatase PAP2 family protein [Bdellovibrionota bacterium]